MLDSFNFTNWFLSMANTETGASDKCESVSCTVCITKLFVCVCMRVCAKPFRNIFEQWGRIERKIQNPFVCYRSFCFGEIGVVVFLSSQKTGWMHTFSSWCVESAIDARRITLLLPYILYKQSKAKTSYTWALGLLGSELGQKRIKQSACMRIKHTQHLDVHI